MAMAVSLFVGVPVTHSVYAAESVALRNPWIEEGYVKWDCVYFGSYPQTEVKASDSVYAKLKRATGWDSNGDVVIDGTKYRRMKKGDATYYYSGNGDWVDWGGYKGTDYYYN